MSTSRRLPIYRRTSFGWEINPSEFRDVLLELHERYQCPPIYITENGAYFDDVLSADGKVHDANRVAFLEGYIKAMQEARERGVDIRGYFVWSLLDNFEWACGYRPTFGLVKVDFNTQKRIPERFLFLVPRLISSSIKPALVEADRVLLSLLNFRPCRPQHSTAKQRRHFVALRTPMRDAQGSCKILSRVRASVSRQPASERL